jgi:hypothetical protein
MAAIKIRSDNEIWMLTGVYGPEGDIENKTISYKNSHKSSQQQTQDGS